MNKNLIQRLLDQSCYDEQDQRELEDWCNVEKFAELIVKECAKEAFDYTWNVENFEYYNDIGWDCLPGDLQSHIEEHFGVKE